MRMDTTWEESLSHGLKVERNLNFSTISNEEDEYGFSRKKAARDPMSHRIIEKRRRDRMNNCLADLSRLVPTNYLKKGRGRIEKTEIIEMAIKHLKHLQAHPCKDMATCEVAKVTEQDHKRQYRLGFHECLSEALRFMVEIEGLYAGDGLCVRLVNHLQKHYDKVAGGMCYTQALSMMPSDDSTALPMDVEASNGLPQQTEGYPEVTSAADTTTTQGRDRSTEKRFSTTEVLKQEHDVNSTSTITSLQDHADYVAVPVVTSAPAPVKVASQLREMLQNPGVPKDHSPNHSSAVPAAPAHTATHYATQASAVNGSGHHFQSKSDEVYKFKNNIKHRFNADLRHHTASPTDSHSDLISLPDDDRTSNEPRSANSQCVEDSLGVPMLLNGHHRPFAEFQPATHSELSVKIPDRHADEAGHPHWDSHAETGSSCGSNPSTPPVARSNGSSSGYSTGGEMPPGSKFKPPGQHSPMASPYSRTPDHILNRSPSPTAAPPQQQQQPQHPAPGVPIFALHPKGTFYIPLTIDASFLAPYLLGMEELAPVLHPVSICVNFGVCHSLKVEKLNGTTCHYRSQSYFVDRFNERYVYSERPHL